MAKKRFRKIKRGPSAPAQSPSATVAPASRFDRFKAAIIDLFLLMTPLVYLTVYLVYGGREGFSAHKLAGWAIILVPMILIQAIFWAKSGQTPGMRAYGIRLVDHTTYKSVGLIRALIRALLGWLGVAVVLPLPAWWLRSDKRMVHDILTRTAVIVQ